MFKDSVVPRVEEVKEETIRIRYQYDRESKAEVLTEINEGSCLRAIFENFVIGDLAGDGFHIAGDQAVFFLKPNFASCRIVIESDDSEEAACFQPDKEHLLCCFALEAVLRHLKQRGLVSQGPFCFQSRRGGYDFEKKTDNRIVSPISFLLDERTRRDVPFYFFYEDRENPQDIVSHTYAYLNEKRCCIFFRSISDDERSAISAALEQCLPKKIVEAAPESSPLSRGHMAV